MNTSLKFKPRAPKKSFLARHLFSVFLSLLALLSISLTVLARFSPLFAEGLSTTLCAWVRIGLGALSSLFPFCLSEVLLILLVLFCLCYPVFCIIALVKQAKKKKLSPPWKKLLIAPLALFLLVVILFCFTFAPCYYRLSVAKHMQLDTPVTEDRLFASLAYLIEQINAQIPALTFNQKGQAIMPADFSHTAAKLNEVYNAFSRQYPFLQQTGFPGKPILLSPYMTYTHISGIYTFFTGESAINTNYPEYLLPFTVAHEYSHQRGIAPENESNFLAFAVCFSSEDPFLRYSGLANVFASVANKAYEVDRDRYFSLIETLSPALIGEYDAYNEFFKQYENSPAGEIAGAVNDSYLKANGQAEGTVSYSLATTLVVNYCCDVLLPSS